MIWQLDSFRQDSEDSELDENYGEEEWTPEWGSRGSREVRGQSVE